MRNAITPLVRIVKNILGIKDISLIKKRMLKRIGVLVYHKKYTADDIVLEMRKLGMKQGSIICIHSSMMQFYNYQGSAQELISKILKAIGLEGTLIMPAYPNIELMKSVGYIFDKENDTTGAGYLAEVFRKFPGVQRSINIQHSVCAIGKYAEYLLKDHYKCHDCWDENSPWRRMCKLNAIVFCLGMPESYIGTFEHCVESSLQYEYPYWAQFFDKKEVYHYYNDNRQVCEYSSYTSDLDRRRKGKNVLKYFDNQHCKSIYLSNLLIKAYYTKKCLPTLLKLGRKGICIYYVPNPKPYFKNINNNKSCLT